MPLAQPISSDRIAATAPPLSPGDPTRPNAIACATNAFTASLSRRAPPVLVLKHRSFRYCATNPPSTAITDPHMKSDADDAR